MCTKFTKMAVQLLQCTLQISSGIAQFTDYEALKIILWKLTGITQFTDYNQKH